MTSALRRPGGRKRRRAESTAGAATATAANPPPSPPPLTRKDGPSFDAGHEAASATVDLPLPSGRESASASSSAAAAFSDYSGSFFYYDAVRSLLLGDPTTDDARGREEGRRQEDDRLEQIRKQLDVTSVRTSDSSSVVEVTVAARTEDDGNDDGDAASAETLESATATAGDGTAGTATTAGTTTTTSTRTETYRLVHLPIFLPLSNLGTYRPDFVDTAKGALMAVHHFNTGNGAVVPQLAGLALQEPQQQLAQTDPNSSGSAAAGAPAGINDGGGSEQQTRGSGGSALNGCNVKLTFDLYDTQRSPLQSSQLLIDHVLPAPYPYQPTALIGAARSAVSIPLATLAGVNSGGSSSDEVSSGEGGGGGPLPQISYVSTSTDLDNRDNFPTFGRVVSSTVGDAEAAVRYLNFVSAEAEAAREGAATGSGAGNEGSDGRRRNGARSDSSSSSSGSATTSASRRRRQPLTQFAILYVRDSYGTAYRNALEDAASKFNILTFAASYNFYTSQTGITNARDRIVDAIQVIRETGCRYIVGVIFQSHFEEVMREAVQAGIAGEGYLWLMGDGVNVGSFTSGQVSFDVSSDDEVEGADVEYESSQAAQQEQQQEQREENSLNQRMVDATHGVGILQPGIDTSSSSRYSKFLQEWSDLDSNDEFRDYFAAKGPLRAAEGVVLDRNHTFDKVPSSKPLLMYDAVIAVGLAACGIDYRGDDDADQNDISGGDAAGKSSDDYFFDGPTLFSAFAHLDPFDGATGPVAVDPSTASRDLRTMSYSVSNVVARPPNSEGVVNFDVVTSASYRSSAVPSSSGGGGVDGNATTAAAPPPPRWELASSGRPYNYSGYTTVPPRPLPPPQEDLNLIGTNLLILGAILGFIVLTSSVYFAVWTYMHRKTRIVMASQPIFLMLICVGTAVMALSYVPMSVEDEHGFGQDALDVACMAGYWTFCIGFSLLFSALFSKTWRINKIMHQPNFRRIAVTRSDVFLPCVVIMSLNILVLVIWTVVSPLKYERVVDYSAFTVDRFGRPTSSTGYCVSQEGKVNSYIFLALLVLINGVAVIMANVQAFRARKINTEYSESRYIAIAMVVWLQSLLIGAPILVLASTSSQANYLVRALLVFVSSGVISFIVFVPKMSYLREYKKRHRRQMEERRNRSINRRRMLADARTVTRQTEEETANRTHSDEPSFRGIAGLVVVDRFQEHENLRSALERTQESNSRLLRQISEKRLSINTASARRRSSASIIDLRRNGIKKVASASALLNPCLSIQEEEDCPRRNSLAG